MKRFLAISSIFALLLSSCVKNDIPYPVVVPHILSLTVEGVGEIGQESISQTSRTVTISLGETVDLKNVRITDCKIDVENVRMSQDIVGRHDLTEPLSVVLTTYQNYPWTIVASRPIERYFTVDGQVGATFVDEANHRMIAYVRKTVSLSDIKVTSLKLGPKGISTYFPGKDQMKDFSEGGYEVEVVVDYNGNMEQEDSWKLFVEQSDVTVRVKKKNIWTKEAYLTAEGIAGQANGFRYREKGSIGDWIQVPEEELTFDGGQFTAHIENLTGNTTYEFYAFTGEGSSEEMTEVDEFTTDPERQLPNNSFENFSLVSGAEYYKWFNPSCSDPESQDIWWASGNGEGNEMVSSGDGKGGKSVVKGTASLGIVLTYPDNNEKVDGEWSVRCESKEFVGLLACGNLFTGRFAGLEGTTGGAVNYGRPWTTRPHKLRLWYKYKPGKLINSNLDKAPAGQSVKEGDPDRCEVAVSVGKWDYRVMKGVPESPVRVNTSKKIYYNSSSEGIVAFGHLVSGETNGWQQVEIPLEYRDTETIPSHIIITCASSYLGDYLIGGPGSTLWIDKMELVY